MIVRPKDYIVVDNKYFFAVVSEYHEAQRALTWLRYVKDTDGMQKLPTQQAALIVKAVFPKFIFHSKYADALLHGIPLKSIEQVRYPEETVHALFEKKTLDRIEEDAVNLVNLLTEKGIKKSCLGISGSLMLNAHNETSDIDILIYGRHNFFKVQNIIKALIQNGDLKCLSNTLWQQAYQRRDCSISFAEYQRHELEKFNKCVSGETKVDISMLPDETERVQERGPFKKIALATIQAVVTDDRYAYDFPARYRIAHESINEIIAYTATYTGQAKNNQLIEATGYIELDQDGQQRLLVGTSREAEGEYIRLLN